MIYFSFKVFYHDVILVLCNFTFFFFCESCLCRICLEAFLFTK